ncbi:hypothetical protein [Palleronia sp. LCG004]|uniref:O-antigen ligase family protein n=1 Tax=Palleronia sp. LCG004 TaxID=3079304 RepID=UPI002943991E|nr:hypothetical protein [Palleronia sp. LCG004]WOI58398.1 hypothetical protein RVY76_18625 [Palleronia sp. LCG004]
MVPLLALLAWPAVTAIVFAKYRIPVAIIVSITAGYLLLPSGFSVDFPMLPALNKDSIAAVSAIFCALFAWNRISGLAPGAHRAAMSPDMAGIQPGWLPTSPLLRILLLALLIGAFLTVLTNGDAQFTGARWLPGMKLYDAFSLILGVGMMVLPLLLARKFLASPEAHRTLLLLLVLAGLCYSLLALYEVRMSPQLSRMVYGYFPHSWVQHLRGNGYRPIVFLSHGLLVSLFFCMTTLAAAALIKTEGRERRAFGIVAFGWLAMTLVLSKSLGVILITAVLVPLILLSGRRIQIIVAAAIAGTILAYPMLRGIDVVPVDRLITALETRAPDRASTFNTRVVNEDQLLDKTAERPLFGWGGYARNRVYDERGRDITITDGYWIIIVGQGGWVRYLSEFGLLTLPIMLLAFRRRKTGGGFEPATCAVALILAANLIDLIPNAGITPLTWLMTGALWGRWEIESAKVSSDLPQETREASDMPVPGLASGVLARAVGSSPVSAGGRKGALRYGRAEGGAEPSPERRDSYERDFAPSGPDTPRKLRFTRYEAKE